MKSLSGVLAFTALVALSVSSQGCAKLKELLKDPQADKPANVRPGQDYAYANNYCERADQMSPAIQSTVKTIEAIAQAGFANSSTTLEKVQAERKAAGEDRTKCQIIEDEIEYGTDYARGLNVAGGNASLTISGVQNIDLPTVASLSVSALGLDSDGILDLSPLAKMSRIKSLWLTANPFWDLTPLTQIKTLRELTVSACTGVRDLAPVVALDQLEKLTLSDMKLVTTRSGWNPLQAMKNLKTLDLRGSDVPNVSVFPQAALKELYVDQQTFGDAELVQIAQVYPALEVLSFRSPNLRDLSPLSRMSAISVLEIPVGAYANLDALRGVTTLTQVSVSDVRPNDFATLSSLPRLTRLTVDGAFRDSSAFLALQSLRTVAVLDIKYQGDLPSLDGLAGMPALEQLIFTDFNGRVGSIAAIASMRKLSVLSLNWARIDDVTPIYGFLDANKTAQVVLNGTDLSRTQESLNNTLRDKFGSRYTATGLRWH